MDSMTTSEAGALLGITRNSVTVLAEQGDLIVSGRVGSAILLEANSVQRLSLHPDRRGRPLDTPTAWAAISILSGGKAAWMGDRQRSRLKARLRSVSAGQLSWLARRRARMVTLRASGSYLTDIEVALMLSGVSEINTSSVYFGLIEDRTRIEGYTDQKGLDALIDAYHLVPDPVGNVIVHQVDFPEAFKVCSSAVLTALDLAVSIDVRERAAGLRVLQSILDQHAAKTP